MIVVDTSIWVDHTRRRIPDLERLLRNGEAGIHEFVIGELLLGSPPDRNAYGEFLDEVPKVATAANELVPDTIEERRIYGAGIGYVDVHLVASTLLVESGKLWTRDKRLGAVATRLGIRAKLE